MVTSETGKFLTDFRNSVRFLCTSTRSPVQNRLQRIMPGRFVQACSVCAVPSGTLLFPLNCFFPNIQLSGLSFLPCYTTSTNFILQKLFHFDKFKRSTSSVKPNIKFSRKFSILLVDLILKFIINYKKYRNILFSKRNYNVFAEFK